MAVNTGNIRAYEDGGVYTHVPGATITLPTTASESLDSDFFAVGAVGPDGVTEATGQSLNRFYIWQKGALGRQTRTESVKTFVFAAAETTIENLRLQYGGSTVTSTSEGAAVMEKPPGTDVRSWILHGLDGDDRAQRVVIERGEIGDRGDVVWSGEGPTIYEWTLYAYITSDGTWTKRYYIDEEMATP